LKKSLQMEINILIADLRKRLSDYKETELYANKVLKQDILSIEIAVCLFEMAVFEAGFPIELPALLIFPATL